MLEFRAYDSAEVYSILKAIYADCRFDFLQPGRARFRIAEMGPIALFNVVCSSAFTYSCEEKSQTLVLHHCLEGGIDYRRNDMSLSMKPGDIAPISSTQTSGMDCHSHIAHQTISVDEGMLNQHFKKLSNDEFDQPILFDFKKLTAQSKKNIYDVIQTIHVLSDDLDAWNLDFERYGEFFSYFLLKEMDGNHSRTSIGSPIISDQKYREAERYILNNIDKGVRLDELVRAANCSISKLNKKFLRNLGVGVNGAIICARRAANVPSLNIRELRLEDIVKSYRDRSYVTPFEHLIELGRNGADPEKSSALPPHQLEIALHHINANLSGKISISHIGAMVGMSRQTFTEAFRKSTGITPAAYILEERVKWAQWMISNTQESLASIAIETGFSSQAHMTTSLRKSTNVTPSELRRKQYYSR